MKSSLKHVLLALGALVLLGWLFWPAPASGPHEFSPAYHTTQSEWQLDKTLAALLLASLLAPLALIAIRRWAARRELPLAVWMAVSAAGLTLLVLGLAALNHERVVAQGGFYSSLPNGAFVYSNRTSPEGCQMCHIYDPTWTGSSTPGSFSLALKPFSAGTSWGGHGSGSGSPAHNVDTDGDGFTNGEELLDPAGTWPYNGVNSDYGDVAYASNPNDATVYPFAPAITTTVGLTNGQTISGSVAVSITLRYAALNRVVYSFRDSGGAEVYSYTANSPALTNYANRFCLGVSPATTSPCAAWDSTVAPNGTYTVVVTAYDRRLVGGFYTPQTGAYTVTDVTINNINLTRFVAVTGSDSGNDCADSAAPCATAQRAVDVAISGDEIRVAGGTYTGVTTRAGETQMVYVTKTVTIRGGYTTSNWGAPPDPVANPTTLDAQMLGRVLYITGNINVTIANLRLINGLTGNFAGGNVYALNAALLFNQTVISNGATNSFGSGGGVYLESGQATFDASTVVSNSAPSGDGGGVYAFNSPVTVTNSSILTNAANYGGGMLLYNGAVVFSNNTVRGNTANTVGGGLEVEFGSITFTQNEVMSNTGPYGGGVDLYFVTLAVVSGNRFTDNNASVYGGGLRLDTTHAAILNNVFTGNFAGFNGGGGVGVWRSQPTLQHNTFISNTSNNGAAVNVFPGTPTAIAVLTNTIIVSHTDTAVIALSGTSATLNGVLWSGNVTNTGGAGTINVSNDYTGTPDFLADGYHIAQTSAAVDRGVATTLLGDIDGDVRPQLSAWDLGADEFAPVPLGGVTINGPTSGYLNLGQAFSATIAAAAPTTPITYTWQATDQSDIIHSGSALADTAVFTWTLAGSKLITVTATNAAGSVVGARTWTGETPATVALGFTFSGLVGAGTDTRGMSAGDVNGDGALDLALGYPGAAGQVYFNDGAGAFTLHTTLGGSASSGNTALGDFSGDGALDVALTNSGTASQVFLNDGAGNFTITRTVGSTGTTRSLAAGDFNSDGTLDLVIGYIGAPPQVFSNAGNGNFALYDTLGALGPGASTTSLAVGDFNGDDKLDIVAGNFNQGSQVFLNDGAGGFTPGSALGSGANTTSVAVGDVNGDDLLDVALDTTVYLNDGAGNFSSGYSVGSGANAFSLQLGDVNGDGTLDIVLGNGFTRPAQIYLNDGAGVFTLALTLGTGAFSRSLAVADFDADGSLDVILGNTGQPNQVFLNNGVLGLPLASSVGGGAKTYAVAVGDLNGDGDLDLALANGDGPSALYFNDGAGQFPLTGTVGSATTTTGLALADLTGDGALDVVLGNGGQASQVYQNNGAGSFALLATLGADTATQAVASGDVNGDGRLDIVLGRNGQPSRIYHNNGAGSFALAASLGGGANTTSVAVGDLNGDGALDVVLGNYQQPSEVYLNNGLGGYTLTVPLGANASTNAVALGDMDGDGRLDIVLGNFFEPAQIYRNTGAGGFVLDVSLGSGAYTHGLALGDLNGDGSLDVVLGNGFVQPTQVYLNHGVGNFALASILLSGGSTYGAAVGDLNGDGALDVALGNYQQPSQVYLNALAQTARLADNLPRVAMSRPGPTDDGAFLSTPAILAAPIIVVTYTLFDLESTPVRQVLAYYSPDGGGQWYPAVAASGTLTSNLSASPTGVTHTFTWDVAASGFFGQSDDVVFRLEAYPGLWPIADGASGPYQRPYAAATTFPFRVRGTQVRVMEGAAPAANALVYRLPNGQTTGGALIGDNAGNAFRTDGNGYLQGRGQLNFGDQLLALAPITSVETYTLYHTNGAPTAGGVVAHTVSAAGVQTLTVSAANPLYLFNLFVSLEWDSHNDPAYLEQLQFNLQRASEYLYDFSNGQAALGQVIVEQNADDWAYSNVLIHANNRLRPFAAQGGIVVTETVDANPVLSDVVYAPGQVHMGATWNRYGAPGATVGEDWAITLGHELSHYLFFLDDVYLGLDADGFLIPINTCQGSAMGDYYSDPANTEFIADEAYWQTNCAQTLSEQTLHRNEWETLNLWYTAAVTPTIINAGPGLMPFDFTSVQIFDPLTPTNPLVDPTFYLNYAGGGASSNESRAYLLRDGQYLIDLGSPFGGQNRVRAWGAKPGDRLCVFDRPRQQFGCETLAEGDDQIQMRQDTTWNPLVLVTPVNSNTLTIQLQVPGVAITYPVQVRIFPEFGPGTAPATFTLVGSTYTRTLTLAEPALNGQVQVWVDEPYTELNPRREAMVAYSIGGNPGSYRAGGGSYRAGGGSYRAGGGSYRAGGGSYRAGGAPIVSPDGQMIFFTPNPIIFDEGEFFTIQGMAAIPGVPPGRTVIGSAYRLVATPGTPVVTGSVSIQYLSNDVTVAGASEDGLSLYFYDGVAWTELATTRSPYFNLVTAPSQGVGVYALMASLQVPLYSAGWNLFAYPLQESQVVTQALASIDGYYSTVYGYYAEDAADPWKLYQVGAYPYVNDLLTLDFGRGYWISATQAITIHFSPAPDSPVSLPASPPDTFYGQVMSSTAFVPAPGMLVQAYVGNVLCGEGATQTYQGQIVYVVDVFADDITGQWAGCGQVGRTVRFVVDGQSMLPIALWDNNAPTELNLTPGVRVYLPVIRR